MSRERERVIAAALRVGGAEGLILTLPPPARHADLLRHAARLGIVVEDDGSGDSQGFLLSNGYYARRKPARAIALRAGQVPLGNTHGPVLTTEDLW